MEQIKAEKRYTQLSIAEKDELRLQYDNDAKYYKSPINKDTGAKYTDEEVLLADTIISFWIPYKRLLELEAINKVLDGKERAIRVLETNISTALSGANTEELERIEKQQKLLVEYTASKRDYSKIIDKIHALKEQRDEALAKTRGNDTLKEHMQEMMEYPQMKMIDMGFWQVGFDLDTSKGIKTAH